MVDVNRKYAVKKEIRFFHDFMITLPAIVAAAFTLIAPTRSADALFSGLAFFWKKLLPSLFPMSILGSLLCKMGHLPVVSRFLSKKAKIGECSAIALILGLVSGFPVGAMMISSLYNEGKIEKCEAERLLGVCSCASPAFVIVTVGHFLLNDRTLGVAIYLAELTSAFIIIARDARHADTPKMPDKPIYTYPTFTDLCLSIKNASGAMLSVAAFVGFFSIISEMVRIVIPTRLSGLYALVCMILEIGGGAGAASELSYPASFVFCALTVGWSGLSVHMQTASVAGELTLRRYFRQKLAMTLLCPPLAAFYMAIISKLSLLL